MRESLAEVHRVFDIVWKSEANERFMAHLLEHQRTGVLALDSSGVIRYANGAAAKLLDYENKSMQGMNLTGIDPVWERYLEEAAKSETDSGDTATKWFHKRRFDIEIAVFTEGGERSFTVYLHPLQDARGHAAYCAYEVNDRMATFAQIMGSSALIQQSVKRAQALAPTDKPVWIDGETGSGKHVFTQAIHSASSRSDDALYVHPCHSLAETEQESILFGTKTEPGLLSMETTGTICLEQIQHMPHALQHKIVEAIKAGSYARLIVTSLLPAKALLKKEEVDKEFARLFKDSAIHVPPLRERPEDIGEIARVLIADFNSHHGRQIVGIRQEVLEDDFMHQLWPGNIEQLRLVLDAMLTVTHGHYVGAAEAKEGWQKVKERLQQEAAGHTALLDLSGTWDEIEQRVILEILND